MPRVLTMATVQRRASSSMLAKLVLAKADPRCTPEIAEKIDAEIARILREGERRPGTGIIARGPRASRAAPPRTRRTSASYRLWR
jgi:hypothetical protein